MYAHLPAHHFLIALVVSAAVQLAANAQDRDLDFFESNVRPLLAEHCFECHSAASSESGLRLDHISLIRRGGDGGAVVVENDVEASRLLIAVRRTDPDLKMPPDETLSPEQVAILERWIQLGTPWPDEPVPSSRSEPADYDLQRRTHWAWQPLRDPTPPAVESDWPSTPIDRFILAKLHENGLEPAAPASKRHWLRRVTYDLVGLPPTPDEVSAFVDDDSPTAYARVIDRLLSSPRYAERWARHWLDVVRYADTTANDGNFVMRYAYRYRNYVIDAFNDDLPYDVFLREQIAGDLLPHNTPEEMLRGHIATGFLMLGPKGLAEADKEQLRMDMVDEQIDVIGRAMLSVTLSCARCHDHKFDPITTADYYSLAGIFRSLRMLNGATGPTSMWYEGVVSIPSAEQIARRKRLEAREAEWQRKLSAAVGERDDAQAEWERSLIGRDSVANSEAIAPITSPREISSLLAWYSADSITANDGGPVTFWRNDGTSDHDLSLVTNENVAPKFVAKSPGGFPVVHFDANEHFLASVNRVPLTGNDPYSIYIVLNPIKSDPGRTQLMFWGSGAVPTGGTILEIDRADTKYPRLDLATGHSIDAGAGELTLGRPQVWSFRYNGGFITESSIGINGQPRTTTASRDADQRQQGTQEGRLVIGGDGSPEIVSAVGPEMNVAEIIIFSRALDDTEEQQLGALLATKYSLQTHYVDVLSTVAAKSPEDRTPAEARFLRQQYLRTDSEYQALLRSYHDDLNELARSRANDSSNTTMVMFPSDQPGRDLQIHVRGKWRTLGDLAPRRTPRLFADEIPTSIASKQSGRHELAEWIASPTNRLTSRAIVNRIWQHHFGRGLAATSDNFGQLGERPSHPELLDYLASRFIDDGWSIKKMHRRIVLSSVYRQAARQAASYHNPKRQRGTVSDDPSLTLRVRKGTTTSVIADPQSLDPTNRLLWKFPRRRLDSEIIRDAILAVSGQLDVSYGGGGGMLMDLFEKGETVDRNLGLVSVANVYEPEAFKSRRRSVYLPVIRNGQAEILSVFDGADVNAVTTRRNESVVATQAMFLLNSPFVREQSLHFARRVLDGVDDASRVNLAFQLAFGRPATSQEQADGATYVAEAAANGDKEAIQRAWQSYCQILFCMNEFVYVE